jgi:hypothetical protein
MCQATLKQAGATEKDQKMRPCEACREEKGRTAFSNGLIDEKRRTPTCKLICLACAAREKDLLAKLRSPEAWKCTKKCRQDWPHVESCQLYRRWHGYPILTKEELTWLQFRERNKKFHRAACSLTDLSTRAWASCIKNSSEN